ncbi:hypothetical protein ACSBR2_030619 [Camellia fascicularis]
MEKITLGKCLRVLMQNLKMNNCDFQHSNAFMSPNQEIIGSVFVPDWKGSVVCPIPRRVALLTNNPMRSLRCHVSHQAEVFDSKAGAELLDIILKKAIFESMGHFVDGLKCSGGFHSLMPKAYIKEVTYMAHKHNVYVSTSDWAEHFLHKGLHKLYLLNMEGCLVTTACLDSLAGLTNLESFNLDSCRIDDEGLVNLTGHCSLSSLYLIFLCRCCTFNNSSVFSQWSVEAYAFESHMYCA